MPDCTIAIVHSDPEVRGSVSALLQSAGFKVRLFNSAADFLTRYEEGHATCIVAGIRMPEMDGLALQKEMLKREIPLPMIVVTSEGDVSLAVRAMKAGAVDFIEEPFETDRLLASVELCLEEGREKRRLMSAVHIVEPRIASLTPREREVLEHLVGGKPAKMIAHELEISPRTLEVHRGHLMAKMQARSFSDLVRMAISVGIGATGSLPH